LKNCLFRLEDRGIAPRRNIKKVLLAHDLFFKVPINPDGEKMKKFNKEELRKYHGENNRPCYVSYKNKVYDLTASSRWKNGVHVKEHHAGMDLTEAMSNAPHGPELLANFPTVGKYFHAKQTYSSLRRIIYYFSDIHAHSVCSHFTVSSFILSPVFLILSLLLPKQTIFENLSSYMLLIGLASLPFSIGFGLLDWWNKYSMDMSSLFKRKLFFSIVLTVTATICLIWPYYQVNLILNSRSYFLVYICLNVSLLVYTVILGAIGGKLVFPSLPAKKWSVKKATHEMSEILRMAIHKERETYRFYNELRELTEDRSQKAVFDFLAHEEKIHEAKLKEILDELVSAHKSRV
jgi:predicted heme/steroid binding protein